jgi:hypothetical protein
MSRSLSRPAPRNWSRQLLAVLGLSVIASSAYAQSPGCQITATWPTWTGGNGFGASIDIRNTGPALHHAERSARAERLARFIHAGLR